MMEERKGKERNEGGKERNDGKLMQLIAVHKFKLHRLTVSSVDGVIHRD